MVKKLEGENFLQHLIHGKRQHEQVIAGALIRKYFMWIVGEHDSTNIKR